MESQGEPKGIQYERKIGFWQLCLQLQVPTMDKKAESGLSTLTDLTFCEKAEPFETMVS